MGRPKNTTARTDSRTLLIQAARELFLERGYFATSVDSITERAGLSKGTFYHHFGSKDGLLDAVVEQLTQAAQRQMRVALEDDGAGAQVRFNRMFEATRRFRKEAMPELSRMARAIYTPDNAVLRERMRTRRVDLALVPVADCIRDGVTEGVFDVPDAEAAARVFLRVTGTMAEDVTLLILDSDRDVESLRDQVEARMWATHRAVEGLLGADEGAIASPDAELVDAWIEAFRGI